MTEAQSNKAYGDLARADIKNLSADVTRGPGDSDDTIARRLYYIQMEVYSAYAGSDLATDFDYLPKDVRDSWLKAAAKVV